MLTVGIDFTAGSRLAVQGVAGAHPVHDTVIKTYRHLNFFQHECVLEVRTPRVKLPDVSVHLVNPPLAGKLSGFTLVFGALVLMLEPQMSFAAVARIVGVSAHRVLAICKRYVALSLQNADLSEVKSLAIDETSRARGHNYITLAADALQRRVIAVAQGRDARAAAAIADEPAKHGCPPEQIESVSIAMSPAFINGCTAQLPNARITFDKFHVVGHANAALDKQINVVRKMLKHWCTCVMRSKVEPVKGVAAMVRRHLEGIVAWAQTRQNNGFLEAINGLFQAAKRRARRFTRFDTIKTVVFLIAGKLDFAAVNPHAR